MRELSFRPTAKAGQPTFTRGDLEQDLAEQIDPRHVRSVDSCRDCCATKSGPGLVHRRGKAIAEIAEGALIGPIEPPMVRRRQFYLAQPAFSPDHTAESTTTRGLRQSYRRRVSALSAAFVAALAGCSTGGTSSDQEQSILVLAKEIPPDQVFVLAVLLTSALITLAALVATLAEGTGTPKNRAQRSVRQKPPSGSAQSGFGSPAKPSPSPSKRLLVADDHQALSVGRIVLRRAPSPGRSGSRRDFLLPIGSRQVTARTQDPALGWVRYLRSGQSRGSWRHRGR